MKMKETFEKIADLNSRVIKLINSGNYEKAKELDVEIDRIIINYNKTHYVEIRKTKREETK